MYVIYIFRVWSYFYGNNLSVLWNWLALFINLQLGSYIVWTFIKLIYLNLGLKSDNTHSYRESLLSSWSPFLYYALCKPSELLILVNLGISLIFVVGYYKIYTEFVSWRFVRKPPFILFLTLYISYVFDWLTYRTESCFLTMNHFSSIKLLVTHHLFWIQSRKERNTHVICRYHHNI